ncbi:carbohydrate ABC transporter permease [Actinomadura coerulea]|uniref:carbohydrate ABC transporter permease n=1 Tax=Actinomadura coerulea TaxID=46159 RepID=UPI00342A3217
MPRSSAAPVASPPGDAAGEGPAAASGTSPPGVAGRARRRRQARVGLLFAAPMLLLFVVFRFGPVLGAVLLSLTDYRLSGEWTFVGVENYTRLGGDDLFWESLRVTLLYVVIFVPLTVLMSLATAAMLHQVVWRRGLFRGIFFLPYVTSIVLAAVIWKWIYDAEDGLVNGLLGLASLGPVDFLGRGELVLPSIALTSAWKGFGYSMLILLAGLQAIPRSFTEAAMIDGAGPWQRFRHITLPLLKPVLFFVLVIETITAFQVFDAMYVMTGGGPVRSSYSLVYMLYDSGFKFFDFGYASAIGLVIFVFVLGISLVQRRFLGKED